MNDPLPITDNQEIRMLSVHADWMQSEYKRINQLVQWHESELLLTGAILCGIIVVQSVILIEVIRLRKKVQCLTQ